MDYFIKFPPDPKDSTFPLHDDSHEDAKLSYLKQQKFPIHYDIESPLRSSQDAFMTFNSNFNLHPFHYANYNRLCGQSRIDVPPQIMRPLVTTFPPSTTFPETSFTGNSIFHHVFPHHYHHQQEQQRQQQQQQIQNHQQHHQQQQQQPQPQLPHFNCDSPEDPHKLTSVGPNPKRPRSEKRPVPELMKDERYREKRVKNNRAAKKSRQERREKEDKNEKELKFLREELRRLVEEEWRIRIQNHDLRTKIAAMRKQLCLDGAMNV